LALALALMGYLKNPKKQNRSLKIKK